MILQSEKACVNAYMAAHSEETDWAWDADDDWGEEDWDNCYDDTAGDDAQTAGDGFLEPFGSRLGDAVGNKSEHFVWEGLQFSLSAEIGLNLTCAKSVFCLDGSAVWEKSLGGRETVVELAVSAQKQ